MKNIFQIYAEKSISVPKALLFGKYNTLSFEAKMMYSMYQQISQYDNNGLLFLNLQENGHWVKHQIVQELMQYNLVYVVNNCLYFNYIDMDGHIINEIDRLENSKAVASITPAPAPSTQAPKQQQQESKRTEAINQAYYANEEVPPAIAETLQMFSKNVDESDEYYSIIMKAKKKVADDLGVILWIEDDEALNDCIINSFVRAMRKIQNSSIKNPKGYLYKAIHKSISDLMAERQAPSSLPEGTYNWLEDRD